MREVFCQRGLVEAQLSLLQRDLSDEEKGPAAIFLARADEGVEVSSDRGGRQSGLPRPHDLS